MKLEANLVRKKQLQIDRLTHQKTLIDRAILTVRFSGFPRGADIRTYGEEKMILIVENRVLPALSLLARVEIFDRFYEVYNCY